MYEHAFDEICSQYSLHSTKLQMEMTKQPHLHLVHLKQHAIASDSLEKKVNDQTDENKHVKGDFNLILSSNTK